MISSSLEREFIIEKWDLSLLCLYSRIINEKSKAIKCDMGC